MLCKRKDKENSIAVITQYFFDGPTQHVPNAAIEVTKHILNVKMSAAVALVSPTLPPLFLRIAKN